MNALPIRPLLPVIIKVANPFSIVGVFFMYPHLAIFVAWSIDQVDFANSLLDEFTNFIRKYREGDSLTVRLATRE